MTTTKYQFSKTLRFGLNPTKTQKEGRTDDFYKSHTQLKDLVSTSLDKISKETDTTRHSEYKELPIIDIRVCLEGIQEYLKSWGQIYNRYDQIAVLKDFYRQLGYRARFDCFWRDNEHQKMPQSQEIKLSSLSDVYENKKRRDYITEYWADNIKKTKQKLNSIDLLLQKFEQAKEQNRDDKKLNEVELRKMFLSFTNIVNDTLKPLCNGSICFPSIEKITDNNNDKKIKDFVFDNGQKNELLKLIEKLRLYFQENGGYVPYGKVTLNKYTAKQKPNRAGEEIKSAISTLRLEDFIKKYENIEQFNSYIENMSNKTEAIESDSLSLLEKIQLFKYKTIPVAVRNSLVKYFDKDSTIDQDNLKILLEEFGKPKSPAEDYKNLLDKKEFNLYKYPLKVAFDYAWETLAIRQHENNKDFPEHECKSFLKEIFNVDIDSSLFFNLYAHLNCIKINLARIDHTKELSKENFMVFSKNIKQMIVAIRSLLEKENEYSKTAISHIKQIISPLKPIMIWLDKLGEKQDNFQISYTNIYENIKREHYEIFNEYEKSKNKIGLMRGSLKHIVEKEELNKKTQEIGFMASKFKQVADSFKNLSSKFGKTFATLRDKLGEEDEIDKISHYGVIVEDSNLDKYVLLSKLGETREEIESLFPNEDTGALKVYKVKSLTSKTLLKLLKNKKTREGEKPFHMSEKYFYKIKQKWKKAQQDPETLNYIKKCLADSEIAIDQKWSEFHWDFSRCETYEDIEKEVDKKGYIFENKARLSVQTLKRLVENKECLLLPIINQDLGREDRKPKNQFTKDWINIFSDNNEYRLHPEFKILYRNKTPNCLRPEEKRYSRFQLIAHFLCEIVPQSNDYIARKKQTKIFNDKGLQAEAVKEFNNQLQKPNDFYVFGVDRGIKQLATLCVLNRDGQIQGGFEIYIRKFNRDKKQWEHFLLEKRNILDLSNLRVETTIENKKVLVDLSDIEVIDKNTNGMKDNKQKIKLKQLAYIRKLQFQMQYEPEKVISFIEKYSTSKEAEDNIKQLITPYKEGERYADLQTDKIWDILQQFYKFYTNQDEKSKRELIELDSAEELKTGIVANIVGVIAYLLERYNYQVYISLEDLTFAYKLQNDGLTDNILIRSVEDKTIDFKSQTNNALAGLGTYQYLEMQLLKKLFHIQKESGDILHLVPAFRSVDNYEKIVRTQRRYVSYPFGIMRFVSPKNTSITCPKCEKVNKYIRKKNNNDKIICDCGFSTPWNNTNINNIHFIQNGDDNAAYHIALKALRNLNRETN